MGAGHNKTVLNFSGIEQGNIASNSGADGLFFSDIDDLEIAHLTVLEAGKNAIKVEKANGLYIHHTATIWDGELSEENGAYGIYPVNSTNVLLDHTFSRGAADAGVYVGQSQQVIVRNSVATENVAGMELENCEDAEFYGNTAEKNTGGLLVFDLPIGQGRYGKNTRVFHNQVINNNTKNFAVESDFAGGVHITPPGTGIIILANSEVEIFNNNITNHKTTGIVAVDYAFAEDPEYIIANQTAAIADGWSPNVKDIRIHDNTLSLIGYAPDLTKVGEMVAVINNVNGNTNTLADISYVGIGESLAGRTHAMNAILSTTSAQYADLAAQANQDGDSAAESTYTAAAGGFSFAAAGALVKPYHQAFPDDSFCLSNNMREDGSTADYNAVYNPADIAARFDVTAQTDFVNAVGAALDSGENALAGVQAAIGAELGKVGDTPAPSITQPPACPKAALPHTKVTFRGADFGCGYDDDGTHCQ